MDRPTKLTSTKVDGRRQIIYIPPEAEKIISDLPPRPVDVVSVVGPMRKGKSHLANLLCYRKSGFPLGDKMKSKTKDFWFWIGPHPVQSDRYLMVVDTEGLDDYSDEEHEDKDMKHLVLATLLSNHLVFNLQGNPDNGLVSNLRLMGDLAERIRVQKDGSDKGNSLGQHFPELWVTLQDVYQETPDENGRCLTPDEFLEDILKYKDGHTKAIRSYNEMRAAVRAFFPKRHLRLIPAPSIKKDVLRNLDKAVDSDLEMDYTDAVDSFTREIWNSGQVKRVNGDDITTTGLLDILQYYVRAINDPNVIPSILGAHEVMAEAECRRALEEQMKTFQKTVEETVEPLMPTDEETCNRKIKAVVETAVTNLSAAVGHWDKDGAWKRGLQEKLERQRQALLEDNETKSKDLCEKIMKKANRPVQQKEECGLYNRVGGFDAYVGDMNVVYEAYDQKAFGPAAEKVLETFRTTEASRRYRIRDVVRKLEEEDRRVKEAEKRRQEAEEEARRAIERQERAEREREAAFEAARERMGLNNAEFGRLALALGWEGVKLWALNSLR
ncbi:guanylate-binding protein 3-like [Branchiostoma floridae x Branchiostoma belcheri]